MDLDTARRHIQASLERMRVVYLKPVFDEWAILGLGPKSGGILAYHGPRPEAFRRMLPDDAEPLRARAAGQSFTDGDIEFVPDASRTRYDAFVKIGATTYLVLNNTAGSMADIRADAKWLKAQPVLFELSEKFRTDPLAVA